MTEVVAPSISLVICTYNREKFLPACLQSLARQTLAPRYFEIIIVDNNSTDRTAAISRAFIEGHPALPVRYVLEPRQGLSYARNRGIAEARGRWITYIDDDAEAEPDFLQQLYDYVAAHPEIAGLGGKVLPKFEGEEPPWLNPFLNMMVSGVDHGEEPFRARGKKYPIGCNMTYRRDLLEAAGGFNTRLKWRMDDKYIFQAVSRLNDAVYYYPSAVVYHNIDADRTSDANFDTLSRRLGSEERHRIAGQGPLVWLGKVAEYIFKWGASLLIALAFLLRGEPAKARYTVRFRWLALQGLLGEG